MNSGLLVFQQLVHLNLNLAVLVLFAWALLGRGRGPKTSLFVWYILVLRCALEPLLYRESPVSPVLDFTQQGFLSLSLGLGWDCDILSLALGLGTDAVSAGTLACLALGSPTCSALGILVITVVTLSIANRLRHLWASPGGGEPVVWSDTARTPHVRGWRSPTIVMPNYLQEALTSEETSAVLAHERAHVKGGDHHLFALLYLARAFCWVIWPLAIVLNGLEQSVERLRDQAAAREVGAKPLARALFKLAQRPHLRGFASFTGSVVRERIRALRPGFARESILVAVLALALLRTVVL